MRSVGPPSNELWKKVNAYLLESLTLNRFDSIAVIKCYVNLRKCGPVSGILKIYNLNSNVDYNLNVI